ncbi:MAG: hypothetical protein QN201_06680 [Armatimonadota bacterium]|nr:hypothetical protein [Armatimonadota bacterium]
MLAPVEIPAERRPGGRNGSPPPGEGGGGWGQEGAPSAATARLGVWVFLAAVSMLFIAFTVSYAARRAAPDWTPVALPPLLWANSGLLLASSVVLEGARRHWRCGDAGGTRAWLGLTVLLGAAFLLGQVAAWRELVAEGVFLASGPHSAFFYLLTAVHGVHLLGGLGGLGYALRRLARARPAEGTTGLMFAAGPGKATGTLDATRIREATVGEATGAAGADPGALLGNVAVYWHFLTALWLYVFFILWS